MIQWSNFRKLNERHKISYFDNKYVKYVEQTVQSVDVHTFLRCSKDRYEKEDGQSILYHPFLFRLSNKLKNLIIDENQNYVDSSFIFNVNPLVDDTVNDIIRDFEIAKLFDLNIVYFNLPISILCDSVAVIDRFISKVKVKPKYMSCLTIACFQLVAVNKGYRKKFLSFNTLSNLFHCGASCHDIDHMQQIVKKKLNNSFPLTSIYTFIEEIDNEAVKDYHINKIVEAALAKIYICCQRPSRVAIAVLVIYYQETAQFHLIEGLYDLFKFDWDNITYLTICIAEQYASNILARSEKQCLEPLQWIISRSTLNSIHFSSVSQMETIQEES